MKESAPADRASGYHSAAGQRYDLLPFGAGNENQVSRKPFGDVPQRVGVNAPVPTVIVRR